MGTAHHSRSRPIEGRLDQHDRDQFEVKLDYTIDRHNKRNRYEVDAYFFLPKSLGVDAQTYPKVQFYSDVQAYIRLKTPQLSFQQLARTEDGSSPLGRVMAQLEGSHRSDSRAEQEARLSRELRLIGCSVRANLRDRSRQLRHRLLGLLKLEAVDSHELEALRSEVAALVQEARGVLAKYRLLRPSFAPPQFEATLAETYALVDEYMSVTLEGQLTRLLQSLEQAGALSPALQAERALLSQCILDERAHRQRCGQESLPQAEGGNETLVYRLGLLKKFVMSVLFLEIERNRDGHGTANFVAALAAGLAMFLATVGSVFVQTIYEVNTLPFVLALTTAYIAKDRVKEWAKLYLSAKMAPWLSDYRVKISSPVDGTVLGSCLERVALCSPQSLPAEVLGARHGHRLHSIEARSKREVVLHYHKRVTIYGRKFNGLHQQAQEINDIIRFSVASFSTRMDDPVRSLLAFDEHQQRVRQVRCNKVYHLNLVFVLRALDSGVSPHIEHARVILDKRGIRRVESNDTSPVHASLLSAGSADAEPRAVGEAPPPTAPRARLLAGPPRAPRAARA
ncbi:MAG: hypothetical protein RL033_3052 [Pseudomonadota bacterium]